MVIGGVLKSVMQFKNEKKICVFGLGYIGLPTAATLARAGFSVTGIDVNKVVVDTVNRGEIHIVEPGLEDLVYEMVNCGRLRASSEVSKSDVFIIAVPTPFSRGGSGQIPRPDLSYIENAVAAIATVIKKGDLVVLESTSPVGTTEMVLNMLSNLCPSFKFPTEDEQGDIFLAHCPERVLPGKVLEEIVSNPRTLGGISPACGAMARALYQSFVSGECTVTDSKTAEMVKLVENASRDVSIAFANELSVICEELGIDVWNLIKIANSHPRVNILSPGAGVGGHCIAVDPWFLISAFPTKSALMHAARAVNDNKPAWVVDLVASERAKLSKSDVTICFCGVTFKPDIDDLRNSPAVDIVNEIASLKLGNLIVVEPNVNDLPASLSGSCSLRSLETGVEAADLVVLLVDHKEFRGIKSHLKEDATLINICGTFFSDFGDLRN